MLAALQFWSLRDNPPHSSIKHCPSRGSLQWLLPCDSLCLGPKAFHDILENKYGRSLASTVTARCEPAGSAPYRRHQGSPLVLAGKTAQTTPQPPYPGKQMGITPRSREQRSKAAQGNKLMGKLWAHLPNPFCPQGPRTLEIGWEG